MSLNINHINIFARLNFAACANSENFLTAKISRSTVYTEHVHACTFYVNVVNSMYMDKSLHQVLRKTRQGNTTQQRQHGLSEAVFFAMSFFTEKLAASDEIPTHNTCILGNTIINSVTKAAQLARLNHT